ncbi:caspase family protein [Methylobacterium trifolii]|uniref:caspase family protein n=1 Tax=Methylobacterium trifolii TaxID=1003092 RepID=UPI001EDDC508|nr:caspase family protein [Methylobacterium trifolii]
MSAILLIALAVLFGPLRDSAGAAPASGRAALVVANTAYPDADAPLASPAGDARALSDELKRRGFAVEEVSNVAKDAMKAGIERFLRGVEPDGIAVVFFGGYGIQVGRRNYLIPVDARIWSEADVVRDGIALDGILEELAKRRVAIRVTILDASRRNPFERRFRSFSQGLAPATGAPGTLTLYSTAAGGVVNEGPGPRSPFVTELVQQIAGSDQTAEQAFTATRDALAKKTRNGQVPAVVANLDETFSFDPDRPRASVVRRKPEDGGDQVAKDQLGKDQQGKDQQAREQQARDQAEKDRIARDQAAKEQAAKDRVARDQSARDQTTKDQAARDQTARDQAARDKAAREQAETRAFDAAQARRTKPAFEDFLAQYPAGAFAGKARAEVARIDAEEQQAQSDFDDAEGVGTQAAYEVFLSRHPTGPNADKARAEIARLAAISERKTVQENERLASLDRRIGTNAADESAYYERGQFYAQRGEAAAAIADFDQAIRLNPASPEAFNNRCWMRAISNDLKRAMADCNEALRLRPGFVDALDSRGLINLKAGALRAAIADYQIVLKADHAHASALYGLGFARVRTGDKMQGNKDIAEALALNPQIDKDFASYGLR